MGHSPAGLFGYSHMLGGFAGGQAEYLRVPFADVGPIKIESGLPDEKVLFLSDIFPTGYMAAENAEIEPGDTVAVWGCGPVGPVRHPERLDARGRAGDRHRPRARAAGDGAGARQGRDDRLRQGRRLRPAAGDDQGPRPGPLHRRGRVRGARRRQLRRGARQGEGGGRCWPPTGRTSLREAIMCCRKGGTISVPGVYVGFPDKIPFGAFMNKGLTMKTGQTHMQRYLKPLLQEDRGRRDRPVVRHHPPRAAGRRARDVQDLPRQEGRLHQGRAEAVTGRAPCRSPWLVPLLAVLWEFREWPGSPNYDTVQFR